MNQKNNGVCKPLFFQFFVRIGYVRGQDLRKVHIRPFDYGILFYAIEPGNGVLPVVIIIALIIPFDALA
jgi:hypothetical protein